MDDIRRKLDLIDKQLSGGFFNSYHKIITTSPLLFAAIGLIIGILIQSILPASQFFWLIILVFFSAASVLLFIVLSFSSINNQLPVTNYQSPVTNNQYVTAILTLACFTCLGAIRLNTFYTPRPNDIRNLIGIEKESATEDTESTEKTKNKELKTEKSVARVINERRLATIRGQIVTDPYIDRNKDWKFARFKFTDPATSFYLKLSKVKTVDSWADVTGTVRVQVDEPVLDLKAGGYIQAYCWLDRFKPPSNPGQFDTAKYLARKNVFIAASIKSRDSIELLKDSPACLFTKIKRRFRNTATQALLDGPSPDDQSEGLLQALLLGYRRNIDSATYEAFYKTGLLHFISLSGMHLGILVGVIWWLCRTIGLMKPARAVICIVALAVFLLIVPPRAPTLRAAVIALVFCLSFLFRRHSNSVNTLSLAAIILLLINPTDLFSAGWQLSFASVLGIILLSDRIHFFLYEMITAHRWFKAGVYIKLLSRIISRTDSYILQLFSVGLSAWLGGAGILLYHFYTINPFTSIWTVIVFPFVAGILTLGYLKIVLSFLLPSVASVLGILVTGLADLLIGIVKLIAHLDFSQILIGRVPIAVVIFYYCTIAFAFFFHFRRPLFRKIILIPVLMAIFAFLGVTKWQRIHRDNLVLTCLDVGHGQAILAQLPGGDNVLFDAGSLHRSNIGRKVVSPFLDYIGLYRLDAIAISHNDIDHINGIPEIIEHCKVGAIYANDAFFSETDTWGTAKFLNDRLLEQGHKIHTLEKGLNLQTPASIKILWPTKQIYQDYKLSDNDKSLVCLIEFAGKKILFCSDIEKFTQQELLRLYPDLKADIVVVPHHGSATTADPDFLENLEADILLYSCEERQYEKLNSFGNDESIANNAKSFYTPRDGAIIIRIRKNGTIVSKCANE